MQDDANENNLNKKIEIMVKVTKTLTDFPDSRIYAGFANINSKLKIKQYWKLYFVLMQLPLIASIITGLSTYSVLRELPYFPILLCMLIITSFLTIGFPLIKNVSIPNPTLRTIVTISFFVLFASNFGLIAYSLKEIPKANCSSAYNTDLFIAFFYLSCFLATPFYEVSSILLLIVLLMIEAGIVHLIWKRTIKFNKSKYEANIRIFTLDNFGSVSCQSCLTEFTEDEEVVELRCNPTHLLHKECIEKLLVGKMKCPYCNETL